MTIADAATRFFEAYRRHDIASMLEQFSDDASVDYIPIGISGLAKAEGRAIWTSLIDVFPDLTNEMQNLFSSADGINAVAEVIISGTQAKDAFGIPNLGRRYRLPHAFIIKGNEDGKIREMRAYWDNAAWFLALGKTDL